MVNYNNGKKNANAMAASSENDIFVRISLYGSSRFLISKGQRFVISKRFSSSAPVLGW